ncbi:unnamed protein product [Caenorhabditis auriculariae]|uniref:Uncharacterized protein n=1 Tax=Caenorhabditis auriculariae TaxID=2777116 RepID=A0A8S1GLZ8_9PELO|nr:unnamed protein product [Caenorhabditis auriculariae]
MGAKCCAPSSAKLRRRLEEHEVYLPSRSVSQDVMTHNFRDSKRRHSDKIENNDVIKAARSTRNFSSGCVLDTNSTRGSENAVTVSEFSFCATRKEGDVAHRYGLDGGATQRRLRQIGGSAEGQPQQQPAAPHLLRLQFRVGSSERRIEYRYHSETQIFDDDEKKKREQLETWMCTQPVALRRLEQKEREVAWLQGLHTQHSGAGYLCATALAHLQLGQNPAFSSSFIPFYCDMDDYEEIRSSTWNFIEDSQLVTSHIMSSADPFNRPVTPRTPTATTTSTYSFHYVAKRVSSGQYRTSVEVEHSQRTSDNFYTSGDDDVASPTMLTPGRRVLADGNSFLHSVDRSLDRISPQQRLSQYSLHSIGDCGCIGVF